MKPQRTRGPRNCQHCHRLIVDPSKGCVCATLIVRENHVRLPDGEYNVKCPECFLWTSAGPTDRYAVVSFVCDRCGEASGGRLAGEVIESGVTHIRPVDTSWIGRSDGFEGR